MFLGWSNMALTAVIIQDHSFQVFEWDTEKLHPMFFANIAS